MSQGSGHTHTVMPKRLAQALMESSMQHFAVGGQVNQPMAPTQVGAPPGQMQTQTQGTGQTQQTGNAMDSGGKTVGKYGEFLTDIYGGDMGDVANGRMPSSIGDLGQAGQGMMNTFRDLGSAMTPQSNFQAQAPNISLQNFSSGINQLGQQQQSVYGQQANLANALLAQSQGQGPNPAQAQLAQNTGQNVANQGALMASQRGVNANPALLARQAAMQGANTQQQAAGQAATLGAQQQLAAQSALQSQQNNMQNQNLQGQSILQGGQAAQNTAINAGQLGAQGINANTASANASAAGSGLGGLMGGIGAVASLFSKGGEVKKMADGGMVNDNIGIAHYDSPSMPEPKAPVAPPSNGGMAGGLGSALTSMFSQGGPVPAMVAGGNVPGKAKTKGDSPKNDTVPTELSPGEIVLPRSVTQAPDMEKKAIEFLRHLKGGKGKKSSSEDFADSKKSLHERVSVLEKCMGGRV